MNRLGMRGGTTGSFGEAQGRMEGSRRDDPARVRSAILRAALKYDEFHADHAANWPLHEPNQIGAQVNALANMGLLEKRNRHGNVEHRAARAAASHGRHSYVWRLTGPGRTAALRVQRIFDAGGQAPTNLVGPDQLSLV